MGDKNFKVGIFLMQKNEFDLFPLFIKYYGNLVGYSNIHVVDNGSSKDMLPLIKNASDLGVNVDFSYSRETDFENKGRIIGDKINLLLDKYDVSIPLDCDEFIGIQTSSNEYTFDKDLIIKYFSTLDDGIYKLKSGNRFRNSITDYTKFYRLFHTGTKLFSKKKKLIGLDLGYHRCKGTKNISSLCYFELHNKPFDTFHKHCVEKMKNRVDVSNVDKNIKYQGAGLHLIRYLYKEGKTLYYSDLNKKITWKNIPGLMDMFHKLNIKVPEHLIEDKENMKDFKSSVI